MPINLWSNVSVDLMSKAALTAATPVTITGITNANPAVVSYTDTGADDPTDGDFVILLVEGMSDLRNTVARVANVNAAGDTFELENVDATDFGAFSAGTFTVAALDVSVSTFTTVNASGGEQNFVPTTTIHQNFETQIPTTTSPFELGFDSQYDLENAALIEMNLLSEGRRESAMRILWRDTGHFVVVYGFVGAPLLPTGDAQDVTETSIALTASGKPKGYPA